jgi:hypothetical protein
MTVPEAQGTIPSAEDNGGAWAFSRRDAERIARAVKRLEASYYNTPAERARYPIGVTSSVLIPAQLSGALAAGSIAAPSSGSATTLLPVSGGPGLSTTGGQAITVKNTYAAAVASGKTVWVTSAFGFWYVVQADC